MKNWIKTQFSFPTKGLIYWTFVYSFSAYLAACGAIDIYKGTFDSPAYFTAGMWQIWAGAMYLMFFSVTNGSRKMRELYQKLIKLQDNQIEEYHKFFTRVKTEVDKAEKEKSESAQKGFTLIELLVVIAIIGILTAVVLSGINSCKEKDGCSSDAPTEYRN